MELKYWLMYLGASLLVWVVAALLNHWRMRRDPDNRTFLGRFVFVVTIVLGFLAFPATLLLTFLIEPLLIKRFSGKDEESYKHGYWNGYEDAQNGRPCDSTMK